MLQFVVPFFHFRPIHTLFWSFVSVAFFVALIGFLVAVFFFSTTGHVLCTLDLGLHSTLSWQNGYSSMSNQWNTSGSFDSIIIFPSGTLTMGALACHWCAFVASCSWVDKCLILLAVPTVLLSHAASTDSGSLPCKSWPAGHYCDQSWSDGNSSHQPQPW